MFPIVSCKMDPMAGEQDWARLAKRVVAARVERGMNSREALAKEGGFSTRFLGDIETGRRSNYDPAYLARLEQALGWATGSVDSILAGGEPLRRDADEEPDSELEYEIAMILRSDLPEAQKQAMASYARELQRRQRSELDALRERQAADRRSQLRTFMEIARGDNSQAAT